MNSGGPGEQEAYRTSSPAQAQLLLPVAREDSQVVVCHQALTSTTPSCHVPLTAAASAHNFTEHMELLEGDYPSPALQPFCYLSRKELSLLISYQKLKRKLNVNITLIKSYCSAFELAVHRNQIHLTD